MELKIVLFTLSLFLGVLSFEVYVPPEDGGTAEEWSELSKFRLINFFKINKWRRLFLARVLDACRGKFLTVKRALSLA